MTRSVPRCQNGRHTSVWPAVLLPFMLCFGCNRAAPLTVEMPLHLEDHTDAAIVVGSDIPAEIPETVEWRFDQPQPDWQATRMWNPPFGVPTLTRTGEGLRVTLTDRTRVLDGQLRGGIHVALPDWHRRDWADVVIRARADSASTVNMVGLGFNLRDGRGTQANPRPPFQFGGQSSPVVRDGTIHTYRLRVGQGAGAFQGPWRELALVFGSEGESGSIELLSVSVVPTGATYADSSHGVRPVTIGERIRRTLFTHAPGQFSYRLRVPEGGRLDAGLGVLGGDSVMFRVGVRAGEDEETLLDERYAHPEQWAQRSVDLSKYAGQTVTLTLETQAAQPGTVAFWGAPTVSGRRSSNKPNVIFYVIDGGGADQMSLYGYNRRTTPNLERLASEGAVFEHAYSNASWTKPSTASFMTSLHSSVLGNFERFDPLPPEARTMAERFHEAGYSTAVFTSNANAGSVSGLERGVDVFRDQGTPASRSSVELHRDFWDWRDASPGEPYWVHFQTTDVHGPPRPVAPFAGLFAPGGNTQLAHWISTLRQWEQRNARRLRTDPFFERNQFAETGIDRVEYYHLWRSVFDETMAHQDYQLGRFVERLRETGQWENTLLIIAADHSIEAATDDFLTEGLDSLPPWQWGWRGRSAIFRSSISRVPLLFVWQGRIAGGQRFRQPVSMIDVLPTVLELAGLPTPAVLQGQSLVPLLLGRAGWQSRPVIFDQFENDPRTGELYGRIEMVDGRWGASLWIGPPRDTLYHRPTPLLLFDVWNDPLALRPVNDEHPALVLRYTELLQRQWEAHRLLARRFTPGGELELTAAQLETLRALGYIR